LIEESVADIPPLWWSLQQKSKYIRIILAYVERRFCLIREGDAAGDKVMLLVERVMLLVM